MPIDPAIKQDATRSLHRSSGSFELVMSPVLLALLGLWLDRAVGTTPLFIVLFAVVGFTGAAVKLYFTYGHSMRQLQAEGAWVGHRPNAEMCNELSARVARATSEATDGVQEAGRP